MIASVWLVPALPLVGVVLCGLFGRLLGKRAHWVAVPVVGLSFLLSLVIFVEAVAGQTLNRDLYTWVAVGDFRATVGFLVDPLSAVMMLVVSGVGFLIHIYSIGYMHDDPGYPRFFAYLNLFMMMMLTLVLANNYVLLFLGWEGVGLCSYLLIGFWFTKKSAADAGKKAFVVNRIGDFGFALGLMLLWTTFGTLTFSEIFAKAGTTLAVGAPLATIITLLLFVGAVGKSAQLPLYVWLPDAMEGPTPVSALIHAATMVTAGVYVVARSAPLYELAPFSRDVVVWVGALTALFAATIALVQSDIKKIIAYSTISQLGYMFLGAGAGAYASGIFHLATHAFFKALLFLGAGSVIHALQGEQDIWRMGGVRRHMPVTAWTFLIASIAGAGIFPLAGFWSKDEILFATWSSGRLMIPWLFGLGTAFLTAFYTFRLYFLVFEGRSRVDPKVAHHLHESPRVMTVPLLLLALFAALAGFAGVPPENGWLHHFLAPWAQGHEAAAGGGVALEIGLALLSQMVAGSGIGVAVLLYLRWTDLPTLLAERLKLLYTILRNKYWVDELYQALCVTGGKALCHVLWALDRWGVDGAVNGTGWLTVVMSRISSWFDFRGVDGLVNAIADVIQGGSGVMRRVQTGAIQNYILAMTVGIFVIVGLYLFL